MTENVSLIFWQNDFFFLCVSLAGLGFPGQQLESLCWSVPLWKGAVYCICITIILVYLSYSNHKWTSMNHLMSSLFKWSFTCALCVSHCRLPTAGTQPYPENTRRSADANVTFNSAHYWEVTFYWWRMHKESSLKRIRKRTYSYNFKNEYTFILW